MYADMHLGLNILPDELLIDLEGFLSFQYRTGERLKVIRLKDSAKAKTPQKELQVSCIDILGSLMYQITFGVWVITLI